MEKITKDDIRWALHWPRKPVPEEVLDLYPDLKEVDSQIKIIEHSIEIDGYIAYLKDKTFDIRDFATTDRIAQREFVRVSGLQFEGITNVKIGRKDWEVFDAREMIVIGIQKRLDPVLGSYNPYMTDCYRQLEQGDVIEYEGQEVKVICHHGAHLMKYYEGYNPIYPSKFGRSLCKVNFTVEDISYQFNGNQLEMSFL